jgi:hypothetical protein
MYLNGEFVKWYEYYKCGTICSDAGYGVIIKQLIVYDCNRYLILKNGYCITQYFDSYNIEKV